MKSIKEKAHEIAWEYTKHYDPIACKQEWCEMAAREGANYVLDEIENVIKANRILGHPFPSLEMRYNQIIDVIEELKSNQ